VQTIALKAVASNYAIDAGDDASAPATDARAFGRTDIAAWRITAPTSPISAPTRPLR